MEILFPDHRPGPVNQAGISFSVQENQQGRYQIFENHKLLIDNLDSNKTAVALMNEVVRSIAENESHSIAIHAAAVCKDKLNIVLPANTGSGKTSLAAWLVSQGYQYLTDELVLFTGKAAAFEPVYRPLNIKPTGLEVIEALRNHFDEQSKIKTDSVVIWPAEFIGERKTQVENCNADLFVFPRYQADSQLIIEPLSTAQIGLELMACNVNGRNFADHGFKQLSEIARAVPGIRLTYSDFAQLQSILPELVTLITSGTIDNNFLRKLFKAAPASQVVDKNTEIVSEASIPAPTINTSKKKLCIGMATYDDYDGVYFSAQAVRLYHPEVTEDTEILVLDNHPTGKCAQALKALDSKINHYRYQPIADKTSTAIRDQIFAHTDADYVLCMDCHVFLEPGAIKKLLDYFDADPALLIYCRALCIQMI